MNVVMIMAGGVGKRFGAVIPKQYTLLNGRPVIDYVIDAVKKARLVDRVVVVIDSQWIDYSENLKTAGFDFAPNGDTRLQSVLNGLMHIHRSYACHKLLIVDAVAPFLYPDLIDDYFEKLDDYNAVITAQKITGGFTNVNNDPLDREQYIITQSPEAFRFEEFYRCFDVNYPYQEMACMLPREAKRYYNYDFSFNLKLTYDYDLTYAEHMLKAMDLETGKRGNNFFDKSLLYTTGLKDFLLRRNKRETEMWLDQSYALLPELFRRWEISSFLPNQVSRYGLVIDAISRKYGAVIVKLIPAFVGRFERELEAMKQLSPQFMCQLLDWDEEMNVMLLSKISNAQYASYEENKKLINFFEKVTQEARPFEKTQDIQYTPYYIEELQGKLENIDDVPFLKEPVRELLIDAIDRYQRCFGKAELYYIHGDLHMYNVLDDGEEFRAIDPNGMIAPLVFECVRFIRNDIKSHLEFEPLERLKILLYSFGKFFNTTDVVNALIVDLAFTTYNSTFENDREDDALLNMQVIKAAKRYLADTVR